MTERPIAPPDGDLHPPPDGTPPQELDQWWYRHVYQGDRMRQLTLRAVLMGSALGMVLSLSNLYVGLKTGWGLGVAITACILSYALWTAFLRLGIARTEMSILENNCMQSTASAAGYSTGGTMVSAIGAYVLIEGHNMNFWALFAWTFFLALLGVMMAVPMKRQMVNWERLKFPSGLAAAETLKSLHASGADSLKKATSLFAAGAFGLFIKFFYEGLPVVAGRVVAAAEAAGATAAGLWKWMTGITAEASFLGLKLNGRDAHTSFGVGLPLDPLMMAAGAIVGLRTTASMFLGAVVCFGILGPWLDSSGTLKEMAASGILPSAEPSASIVRKWALWTGSAMMVTAGLTAFSLQWRSVARALSGIGAIFAAGRSTPATGEEARIEELEVPASWFLTGLSVAIIGVVVLQYLAFGIPIYWGFVSVLLAFVLSLVACRATGETDITPIGAMGKVTQLFYGVVMRGQPIPNLMTAGVTAGAATSAADLLTDLKSGYVLGANPRQQFLAQLAGIVPGTLITVPVWFLLVKDSSSIGAESKNFPAPAAEVWASVARLLSKGIESLHPTMVWGMAVGAFLGIALTLAEAALPKYRKWIPSATGLGLAFVINFADSLAMFMGAAAAWLWSRANEKQADLYVVPVASGIIAGESIMGIAIALLGVTGIL